MKITTIGRGNIGGGLAVTERLIRDAGYEEVGVGGLETPGRSRISYQACS